MFVDYTISDKWNYLGNMGHSDLNVSHLMEMQDDCFKLVILNTEWRREQPDYIILDTNK